MKKQSSRIMFHMDCAVRERKEKNERQAQRNREIQYKNVDLAIFLSPRRS